MAAPVAAKLRRRRRQLDRLTRPEPVPGSYSIVSTMRESPDIVAAFIAHHLTTDADEIFVFLDEADPVVEDMLAGLPRCRVTVCDERYWLETLGGERIANVVRRQNFNAEQARGKTGSEWLVHIDADEFLIRSERLREELAAQPADIDLVRIWNYERFVPAGHELAHIYDGQFRRQIPRKLVRDGSLFGPATPFVPSGLAAYHRGKTATRCDSDLRLSLHAPLEPQDGLPNVGDLTSTILLHFDGHTPVHWVKKQMRRAELQLRGHSGRLEQIKAIDKMTTHDERLALYRTINVLSRDVIARLADLDALYVGQFDPLPAMKAQFPDRNFDTSIEAFDRRLAAQDPRWFAENGVPT
jgi:hypothetical protein